MTRDRPPTPAVGARVRALREAIGLSLRDLAERSGCQRADALAGRARRDQPDPGGRGAHRAGLDLSLSQLLRLDEGEHVASSAAAKERKRRRGGHRVEELTPPLPGQRADVSCHRLDPGATTGGAGDPPIHEPGSRETAVVLRGDGDLVIDGERHELRTGDSVTFDADLAHHFENDGDEPARAARRGRGGPAEELSCRRPCSTSSGTLTRSPTG